MATSSTKVKFDKKLFDRLVETLMGAEAVIIADYLLTHEDSIDEDIATETQINIKTIRSTLFKLNEHSLAFFRRERNLETGYFIYHWNIDKEKLLLTIEQKRQVIIRLLQERIDYENDNLLYVCGTEGCNPLSLDEAYEYSFICPICQEPLNEQSGEDIKEFLEVLVAKLQETD